MDVVRYSRRSFKEFIVRLFIDALLLFVRLVDRIYGNEGTPLEKSPKVEKRENFSKTEPPGDDEERGNFPGKNTTLQKRWLIGVKQTDDRIGEGHSGIEGRSSGLEGGNSGMEGGREESIRWADRPGSQIPERNTSWNSDSLDEVSFSTLESTSSPMRQISTLSDYYSEEESLANEWNAAWREEAIVDSLAIAQSLEGGSFDPKEVKSAHETVCNGLERLEDISMQIMKNLERWGEDSVSELRRLSSTEGLRGEFPRRVEESQQRYGNVLGNRNQTLGNHQELRLRREALKRQMVRERNNVREAQRLLEKTKIELSAKKNDLKRRDLIGSCEALYSEHAQLRSECKKLTNDVIGKIRDVGGVSRATKKALEELGGCLQAESERLNVWLQEKASSFEKFHGSVHELKRNFDARKSKLTSPECKVFLEKMVELQRIHTDAFQHFLDDWKELSCRANVILSQEHLDSVNHEERCLDWKDFTAVDDFQERAERHFDSYKEFVPRICLIHDRRSAGSTGLYESRSDDPEFRRFYEKYETKMKALEDDFSTLKKLQAQCSREIRSCNEVYERVAEMTGAQKQHEQILKQEESRVLDMNVKLTEYKGSIEGHLIDKQGNQLLAEVVQVERFLIGVEEELEECLRTCFNYQENIIEFHSSANEILQADVLYRHFERLKSFADGWEEKKQFEKIFSAVHLIENFNLVETPQRLEFKDHEERVAYLEKRLPILTQLHDENCVKRLDTWKACSLEYDENEQEAISCDDLEEQRAKWRVYCGQSIPTRLDKLEKDFLVVHQRLLRLEGALSELISQGFEFFSFEALYLRKNKLDSLFLQARDSSRKLEIKLEEFNPTFGKYSDMKRGVRLLQEALEVEEYSAVKLRGKLEECGGLLWGHRDHVERRRIKEKCDSVSADLENCLQEAARKGEEHVGKLVRVASSLLSDFVNVIPEKHRAISELVIRIPRKILLDLEHSVSEYEQRLECLGRKIEKCQQTIITEENSVLEFFSLVQRLADFIKSAEEDAKFCDEELETVAKMLPTYESFVENHERQEKRYADQLSVSKETCVFFYRTFASVDKEVEELKSMFSEYRLRFPVVDESAKTFREAYDIKLTEISSTLEDFDRRVNDTRSQNKATEGQVLQGLREGRPQLNGIRGFVETIHRELRDQREVHGTCRLILDVLAARKSERETTARESKERLQRENYGEHCKTNERNPILNTRTFKCSLCSLETKLYEGIVLRECLHEFCIKCLKKYVRDLRTAEAACPASFDSRQCEGVILDKEIRFFGDEIYEMHVSRSFSQHVERSRDLVRCWNFKCGKVVAYSDRLPLLCNAGDFKCPHCLMRNCKQCKVVHEERETCESYQLSLPYRKVAESVKCRICENKEVDMAFVQCGHVCCKECVQKLKANHQPPIGPFLCPFCKIRVDKVLKLYLTQ